MADRQRSSTSRRTGSSRRPDGTAAKKTAKKAAKKPAKKATKNTAPTSGKKSASRSAAPRSSDRDSTGSPPQRRPGSAARIASSAASQLLELTGKEPEGVVAVSKDGDSWLVEVEVLELRRIPNTTDVLASYEVTVDTDGELVGYRRLRRYVRGSSGEE